MRLLSNELGSGGLDMRDQPRSVSGEDLFYLLAGESRETFHVGSEVVARVTRVMDSLRILVRLDNSLQGSIGAQDFSDNPRDIDMASNLVEVVGAESGCDVGLESDVSRAEAGRGQLPRGAEQPSERGERPFRESRNAGPLLRGAAGGLGVCDSERHAAAAGGGAARAAAGEAQHLQHILHVCEPTGRVRGAEGQAGGQLSLPALAARARRDYPHLQGPRGHSSPL